MSNETKNTRPSINQKPGNDKQIIPTMFSKEQVDNIVKQSVEGAMQQANQTVQQYAQQLQYAQSKVDQLQEALRRSNVNELYQRMGLLLECVKLHASNNVFSAEKVAEYTMELENLITETKLIAVPDQDTAPEKSDE